jgi:hypothetical protein
VPTRPDPAFATAHAVASEMRHLFLSFVELQIAMALGALVCLFVGGAVRSSQTYAAAFHPGTVLYFLGDVFFLTAPVVAWMLFRSSQWRKSLELAVAMLAPVATIVVLGELTRFDYRLWLVTAMYPAMSFGMLGYMLYRRDLFSRWRPAVSKVDW